MGRDQKSGFWQHLSRIWGEDAAVTSIEYALIASLIAVVIVGAVATVGSEVQAAYQYVADCVVNLSCPP